jgi:hypothetical protein
MCLPRVTARSSHNAGYGYYVLLRAPDGTYERFAHMDPDSVRYSRGEQILQGSHLGRYADPTNGRSTGPHLHYEKLDASMKPIDLGDAMPVMGGRVGEDGRFGIARTGARTGLPYAHQGIDIRGRRRRGGFETSFP